MRRSAAAAVRLADQLARLPLRHGRRARLGLRLEHGAGRAPRKGCSSSAECRPRTFGRGGSCVGACYLTAQNVTDDVLEHEAVHKRQWQRYGMLFPLFYLLAGREPL